MNSSYFENKLFALEAPAFLPSPSDNLLSYQGESHSAKDMEQIASLLLMRLSHNIQPPQILQTLKSFGS